MRTVFFHTSAALGLCLLTPASGFMVKPSSNVVIHATTSYVSLEMISRGQTGDGDESLSTRSRYKLDIDALDKLLDAQEEEKLEEIRALIKDIQDTRKSNPEIALPHKVREALADFHRVEAKYGRDSREAKIAHEYFLDISNAANMKPEHYYEEKDSVSTFDLNEALDAVSVLEDLKEIAHMEKLILDRFGTTDFEIGEGFLERGIGKEDPDTYGLWP